MSHSRAHLQLVFEFEGDSLELRVEDDQLGIDSIAVLRGEGGSRDRNFERMHRYFTGGFTDLEDTQQQVSYLETSTLMVSSPAKVNAEKSVSRVISYLKTAP